MKTSIRVAQPRVVRRGKVARARAAIAAGAYGHPPQSMIEKTVDRIQEKIGG